MQALPLRLRNSIKRLLFRHVWTFSQAGQDLWVFGEAFNERERGFFLDIGAHDGITFSNTYVLERRYNWTGLCIEANPLTFGKLSQNRRATCINACLDNRVGEVDFALRGMNGGILGADLDNREYAKASHVQRVKTVPLMNILMERSAPSIIDYMSIDVEGAEDRVLESFDFSRYQFNCLTIERPSERLRTTFAEHGYLLIKEIYGLDCFYVHRNYLNEYNKNLFNFYKKKQLLFRWS